ncbi:hypothetical protein Sfum_1364 [Syntrophobacter fumaroxidans MPOB]|uniref:Uncharacterized protein n=1 Tax=Syntrophobacter fumaroxidans (strain DSM 10017 / MPOB) TaxID=335543 RepID=A0LI03_SYNFM|nr:hypothetical protein Sfum_1364 [Syntrophobacter fumaroxidans MPOB]
MKARHRSSSLEIHESSIHTSYMKSRTGSTDSIRLGRFFYSELHMPATRLTGPVHEIVHPSRRRDHAAQRDSRVLAVPGENRPSRRRNSGT